MFGTCRLGIMIDTKISIYYSFRLTYQAKDKRNKRKKTKTYGLGGLYASLRQGRSLLSQPCPTNGPTATR